jgi:peptide/nickel transport system permease protein
MTPIQPPAPTQALAWWRVISRRTLQAVLLASLVSSLCFAMTRLLPGDMAMRIAAGRHGPDLVNLAAAQAVHEELGLGRPAWQAWLDWQWQLAQLNLGTSWVSGQSVWREVSHQLGATLELSLAAVALAMLLGLPLGVVAGLRPMGWVDKVSMALAVWFKATPTFLLAVLLMLGVAVHLGILPVGGDAHAQGLALPALTLALGLAAGLARITRQAVQAAVSLPSHEFMRTKGLSDAQAWWRHGWRHASVPVLNYLGVQAVFLIEGAVVVESLFAWPGIGHALVHAIFGRDIPMIQGTALCMGLCVVACNLMVDALGRVLDPRPTWSASA